MVQQRATAPRYDSAHATTSGTHVRDGRRDLALIAQRFTALGTSAAASRLVGQAARMGVGRDGFLRVFYDTLLAGPIARASEPTAVRDPGAAMWQAAAPPVDNPLTPGMTTDPTARLGYGTIAALKDAVRLAGRGARPGSQRSAAAARALRLAALASDAPRGFANDQPTAAALAYLRAALPMAWQDSADGFARYVTYRAELRGLTYDRAVSAGFAGDALGGRIADLMGAVSPAGHEEANAGALAAAFHEPLTALATALRRSAGTLTLPVPQSRYAIPLGRILQALVAVPTSIVRLRYAPPPEIAASAGVERELRGGGARRDLAIARIGLGGIAALSLADVALMGAITGRGPSSPTLAAAWREAGHEPWSVRVGEGWRTYDPAGGLGRIAGAVADTVMMMKFAAEHDRNTLATALILGAGAAMLSLPFVVALARLLDALETPSSDDDAAAALLAILAAPRSDGALAAFAGQQGQLLDAVEARLPLIAEGLPPARTLWGDPIDASEALASPGVAAVPSPAGVTRPSIAPIDDWIAMHRRFFASGDPPRFALAPPGPVQTFSAGPQHRARARLTPAQHDRFQVLAGQAERDPHSGLGARANLDALLAGRHPDAALQQQWDRASPGGRALLVETIVNAFRDQARQRLVGEFPALGETLAAGWEQTAGTPGLKGALT